MEALPSVETAPVLVDVSALDVLTLLSLVVSVTALPPLESELSPLVEVATVAAELVPPADESSDVALVETCPLPFELAVSVACSPDGLPPPPHALAQTHALTHARTHANGLCRTQLMRVNFAPHLARRKQALLERAEHILSSDRESRDHCGPTMRARRKTRVVAEQQLPDGERRHSDSAASAWVTTFNETIRAFHER